MYWLFDSLDEGDAKDKKTSNSGYTLKNLNLDLIGRKLREEEDTKNVKYRRKSNTTSTNKASKPVNAVAKSTSKNGPSGKVNGWSSSKSKDKLTKRSGMDNGVAPAR